MIMKAIRLLALGIVTGLPVVVLAQNAPPAPPPGEGGGRAEFAKVREACRADVDRLCKDVKPGHGQIRECLKAHEAELSDSCKAAINEAREHRQHHE
jgi:Cysteine rich repeat